MNTEQKAKAYDEALEKAKQIIVEYDYDEHNNVFMEIFPELKESEDEKVRKEILEVAKTVVLRDGTLYGKKYNCREWIDWLEKQKDINSKEYVFRPHAGCDINTAAIQAVEQQKLGKKIILAFNGAYIPVEEKTADDIINEYYSWLEKQGEQQPTWSEEDERSKNAAIQACKDMVENYENSTKQYEDAIDWLKSLKDRYIWKPSDEQMEALSSINLTGEISYGGQGQVLIELYNDLKKLREE